MLKRYDNIIYKLFLKSKKTIKVILSSMTRIRLIVYMEDPEEVFSVDYAHIEDTKVEETTVVDITTTSYPVGNNIIRKRFLRSKTIKAILSSITRIGLTVYIEDPKKALSIDCTHIKDTKAEKTTIVNIITTSHPVRNNAISVINLNAS